MKPLLCMYYTVPPPLRVSVTAYWSKTRTTQHFCVFNREVIFWNIPWNLCLYQKFVCIVPTHIKAWVKQSRYLQHDFCIHSRYFLQFAGVSRYRWARLCIPSDARSENLCWNSMKTETNYFLIISNITFNNYVCLK